MFLCLSGQWTALAERGERYWDERPRRKKVVQVKVEDESEVSALKTLGFRVCS